MLGPTSSIWQLSDGCWMPLGLHSVGKDPATWFLRELWKSDGSRNCSLQQKKNYPLNLRFFLDQFLSLAERKKNISKDILSRDYGEGKGREQHIHERAWAPLEGRAERTHLSWRHKQSPHGRWKMRTTCLCKVVSIGFLPNYTHLRLSMWIKVRDQGLVKGKHIELLLACLLFLISLSSLLEILLSEGVQYSLSWYWHQLVLLASVLVSTKGWGLLLYFNYIRDGDRVTSLNSFWFYYFPITQWHHPKQSDYQLCNLNGTSTMCLVLLTTQVTSWLLGSALRELMSQRKVDMDM